jgi:hypothetical protein
LQGRVPYLHPWKGELFVLKSSFLSVTRPKNSVGDHVPYSPEALRQDLCRVRDAWEVSQSSRDRDAIYYYLNAVFALVSWWSAERREVERAHLALQIRGLTRSGREHAFAAIIRCTADPAKADKRTRSKWSRVMRYAAAYKQPSEPLQQFIKRKGGINECAARASKRLRPAGPMILRPRH